MTTESQSVKAIIVGGGIGGLGIAVMLHARGVDRERLEQADVIREPGVGANTLPHATKQVAPLGRLAGPGQAGAIGLLIFCSGLTAIRRGQP